MGLRVNPNPLSPQMSSVLCGVRTAVLSTMALSGGAPLHSGSIHSSLHSADLHSDALHSSPLHGENFRPPALRNTIGFTHAFPLAVATNGAVGVKFIVIYIER